MDKKIILLCVFIFYNYLAKAQNFSCDSYLQKSDSLLREQTKANIDKAIKYINGFYICSQESNNTKITSHIEELRKFEFLSLSKNNLGGWAKKNGEYFLLNQHFQTIKKLEYDLIFPFSRKNCFVVYDKSIKKYGVVDYLGNITTGFKFENVELDYFDEGILTILDGKRGMVNKNGIEVIKNKYERIGFIYDKANLRDVYINGLYGYVNNIGLEVISPRFDDAHEFVNGLAKVGIKKKYGFIDEKGVFKIPLMYDAASFISTEGLFVVKLNNKWGYVNVENKTVIPFEFDDADNFINGLANVSKKGLYGLINKKGEFVVAPIYDRIYYSVSDGFNESTLSKLIAVEKNRKYGYINTMGKIITPLIYDYVGEIKNGIGIIEKNKVFGTIPKDVYEYTDKGFVNEDGKVVVEPLYDELIYSEGGLIYAKKNNKHGLIDKKGSIIIPIKYDIGFRTEDGNYEMRQNYWVYIYDKKGQLLKDYRYEETN